MEVKSGFYELAKQAALSPQPEAVMALKKSGGIRIGIPREVTFQENRVGLTPQAVALLIHNGYEVFVEAGSGREAKFYDADYEEYGAIIKHDPTEIFRCDIVVKVSFPSPEEIEMMGEGITIFSALHYAMLKKEDIQLIQNKKITAVCFEYLKDNSGSYPITQSMSEIAGNTSILIAAEYLSNINHGKGVMLGGISGIPPSEVVIIGAGTVGQFACQTAIGLGAEVKVFDDNIYKIRRLQNSLGTRVYTSIIHPNILIKALRTADVVIGAIRPESGRTPMIVNEEMVMEMKYGSVIVDVAIDQGGCFETSHVTDHNNPIFEKHGVIHYCVPNIPSRVSRTASYALSNILSPLLVDIHEQGGIRNFLWGNEGIRNGVYIYKGNLTNKAIGEKFGIQHKDLDFLMAAQL